MAKRFFSTKIWDEDWFLDMPTEYRLFWFYLISSCDHAGIFKVNLGSFCRLNGVKVDPSEALVLLNTGKQRIREINKTTWLIEDFFCYQYGETFNPNNRVHKSIETVYKLHGVNLTSIRGLKDHKEGVKDKDKDKDIKEPVINPVEVLFDKNSLTPKMVEVFKKHYPYYPVDEKSDFQACLQIAYLIAKQKKWSRESVLTENLQNVLDAWDKIVQFSTTDKWYSTRSISDFQREFQRIVESMTAAAKPKTFQKQEESKSAAPKLTRL